MKSIKGNTKNLYINVMYLKAKGFDSNEIAKRLHTSVDIIDSILERLDI